VRKATGECGDRAARVGPTSRRGQRAHAQRFPLLGEASVREPAPMLRGQRQRAGKVPFPVGCLGTLEQPELGRVGLSSRSRRQGPLQPGERYRCSRRRCRGGRGSGHRDAHRRDPRWRDQRRGLGSLRSSDEEGCGRARGCQGQRHGGCQSHPQAAPARRCLRGRRECRRRRRWNRGASPCERPRADRAWNGANDPTALQQRF
jgi:hypothetical protein